MVNYDSIERGLSLYIENEVAPELPSNGSMDKVRNIMLTAAAMYAVTNARGMVGELLNSGFVKSIGAVDDNGEIDIDGFAEALKKCMREPLRIDIPLVHTTLKFSGGDIDRLLDYIHAQ